MLLIGIIIGASVGYFGNIYVTNPILTDFQSRLYKLDDDYNSLEANFTELDTEKKVLEQQIEVLQSEYDEIQIDKESLDEELEALLKQVKTLEAMYESLLEEYQGTLGGLNFSNHSIPVINRNFTWGYNGETYTISYVIPEPMYEYYKSKPRYVTTDYRGYILHPYDDAYLGVFIKEFDKISSLNNMSSEETAEIVVSFVQNLHYITDETTGFDEYPKFPIESLVDLGGDCEDTSILLSHLLEAMEINTALITLPGHMAIGVEVNVSGVHWNLDNHSYYYLETTVPGWDAGKIPPEHIDKQISILSVEPIPFLIHTWNAKRTNNEVDVTVTYTNDSPYIDDEYKAWVGIELDSGELYSEKIGNKLDLSFGDSKSERFIIEGPRHDTMRLIVGVLTPGGDVITQKFSEYFVTR
jgi:hypothetical protein